jgi:hypothetical protein
MDYQDFVRAVQWGRTSAAGLPEGISTGRIMFGSPVTALQALDIVKNGGTLPIVFWDAHAPIVGRPPQS